VFWRGLGRQDGKGVNVILLKDVYRCTDKFPAPFISTAKIAGLVVVEIALSLSLSGLLPSTLFNVIINNTKMTLGRNLYGSLGIFKVFWLIKAAYWKLTASELLYRSRTQLLV